MSAQEELTNSRASWDQTVVSHHQKEADSTKEIEKLRSDQALARQMSATTEATIETLRHQLSLAREEANQQTQPTSSNTYRYRGPLDSPATPMINSQARGEIPYLPDYCHIGSAADPGYYDPMRNAMWDSSSSSNPLYNSTSSTIPLTPSAFFRQTRLGSSYPLFKGSKVKVQGLYDLTLIGTNRSRSFGGTPAPYLKGSRFTAVQVHVRSSSITCRCILWVVPGKIDRWCSKEFLKPLLYPVTRHEK